MVVSCNNFVKKHDSGPDLKTWIYWRYCLLDPSKYAYEILEPAKTFLAWIPVV